MMINIRKNIRTHFRTSRASAVMPKLSILLLIVTITAAISAGCASSRTKTPATAASTNFADDYVPPFSDAERFALAQDHFILARDLERRGMTDAALRVYQYAFDFWPESRFLRDFLIARYTEANAHEKIANLFYSRDGTLADSLTLDEKRVLIVALLRMNDAARAAVVLESLGSDLSEEEVYSLALVYSSMGNNDRALAVLRTYFGATPRALRYGIQLARVNIGERKITEAADILVKLRAAHPKNAEVSALLGSMRIRQGDTTAALPLFRDALEMEPNNEVALAALAYIYSEREDFERAIPLFRRLIERGDPQNSFRYGLMLMLFSTNELEEALTHINFLLPTTPAGPEQRQLLAYRGNIFLRLERFDEAERDHLVALALDTLHSPSWRALCVLYIMSKDTVKLRDCAARFLANAPESAMAWTFSGISYTHIKEYDRAVAQFMRATQIDPDDHFAWLHLSVAFDRLRQLDESAVALGQVLRIDPGNFIAANNLGYLWADQGIHLDSAKTLILRALAHDSTNSAFLDSYAWVLFRLGDYEAALRYINKAIEHETESFAVHYEHLGEILFALKNYAEAQAAFRRSLEFEHCHQTNIDRINARLAEIEALLRGE